MATEPGAAPPGDDAADAPSAGVVRRAADRLVDALDLVAGVLIDVATDRVGDRLRRTSRTLAAVGLIAMATGVFAIAAPRLFLEVLPYALGVTFLLVAYGLFTLAMKVRRLQRTLDVAVRAAAEWRQEKRQQRRDRRGGAASAPDEA